MLMFVIVGFVSMYVILLFCSVVLSVVRLLNLMMCVFVSRLYDCLSRLLCCIGWLLMRLMNMLLIVL